MANTSLKNFRVSEEYLAELLGPLDPARLLKLKLPFLEERWTLKVVAQTQMEMLNFPLCMITFKCVCRRVVPLGTIPRWPTKKLANGAASTSCSVFWLYEDNLPPNCVIRCGMISRGQWQNRDFKERS